MIAVSGPGEWQAKAEMLGTGRNAAAVKRKFYDRQKVNRPQAKAEATATPQVVSVEEGHGLTASADTSSDGGPDAQLNTESSCAICMESAAHPVITPCGHTYCRDCITYWLNQKEAGTDKRCPVCREGLRSFARKLSFSDRLPEAWQRPVAVGDAVMADFGGYGTPYELASVALVRVFILLITRSPVLSWLAPTLLCLNQGTFTPQR